MRKKMLNIFSHIIKYITFKPQRQLRMRMASLENLEDLAVPSGYQIRTYQRGDEELWVRIIKSCFGENFSANIDEILDSQEFDPNGLFFVSYQNRLVGTVYAWKRFVEGHKVGYVHLLGVIPEHRGKKLGHLLVLCALHHFKKGGIQEVILDTDDFRLPAMKTYLSLGFELVYLEPSHKRRWKAIFEKGLLEDE